MAEFTEHGSSAFGFPNAFARLAENNRDVEETPLTTRVDTMYKAIAERNDAITEYLFDQVGSSTVKINKAHISMLSAAEQSIDMFFDLHRSRNERIELVAGLFYITHAAEAQITPWLVDYAPTHGEFVPQPFQRILLDKYRSALGNNTRRRQILSDYYRATFYTQDILVAIHRTREDISSNITGAP